MLDAPLHPTVNAALNGGAAVCIVAGWWLIRHGRRRAHRAAMLAAVTLSVAFLASYLLYHAQAGSVRYQGDGPLRTVYLAILLTHTVLAAVVPFAVGVALGRALRGRFAAHRAVARWTVPAWLYVSVTGVVIYLMLYTMGR